MTRIVVTTKLFFALDIDEEEDAKKLMAKGKFIDFRDFMLAKLIDLQERGELAVEGADDIEIVSVDYAGG